MPSVLPGCLADVVTKPPATLGRVGRNHRPLAPLAEQQSGEQRLLVRPDHVRALALPGSEFPLDLFPYRRLDNGWVFPRIDCAAVFHLAGVNRVGQKAAHRGPGERPAHMLDARFRSPRFVPPAPSREFGHHFQE